MSPTFSQLVPAGYGYACAAASSLGLLLAWQTFRVSGARKRASIPYPQLYATPEQQAASKEALIFNCTQRAHANTLEHIPIVLFSTLFTGLQHPRFAAIACFAFFFGRILYTLGYSTGTPIKRRWGSVGNLASIALTFSSCYTSYRIIIDGLI